MAIKNDYDDGVPLRFAYHFLTTYEPFTALYEKRVYEEDRIPTKPGETFIVVKATELGVSMWAGIAEYIGQVAAQIDIVCVRKYPTGQGSEMDFRETMKILRRAVCGHCGVDVFDADGVKIGEVDESRYLHKINLTSYEDGNFDVLQKGISLYLAYR